MNEYNYIRQETAAGSVLVMPQDLQKFPGMMFSSGLVGVVLTSRNAHPYVMTTYIPVNERKSVTEFVEELARSCRMYLLGIQEICLPNELFIKYNAELKRYRLDNKE
jgi:hypothetical protein